MKMLWSDLMPGDKVKFTDECLEYYEKHHKVWKNYAENKIFTISEIQVLKNIIRIYLRDYTYDYIDILHNGFGYTWKRDFSGELLELVELCL